MPSYKKTSLRIAPPDQNTDFISISHDRVILSGGGEVFEQKAGGSFHPLVLYLPKPDLIDDRGWQDGHLLAHLRVGVGLQIADDLVGGDAVLDGAADALAGDAAGDHVRVAGGQLREEGQDGDLQRRRCVCVEAVVGLDDDEALAPRGGGGVEAAGDGAESGRVGCQGRGEACGEDLGGRGRVHVYQAEVREIGEHGPLRVAQHAGAVGQAELEGAEHE